MAERSRAARLRVALGSVRGRTTLGAVLVVGVALVLAGLVMVVLLRRTLERNVRAAAEARARDVAALLRQGTSPASLPLVAEADVFVQIVDDAGAVVAASPMVAGEPGLGPIGSNGTVVRQVPREDPDPYLVVSRPAGSLTVIVGRTLDHVQESASAVAWILLLVIPALLLVVGLTTWRVVGRALAPVEAIREEVTEISAAELHRRVPEPLGDDEIARLATTMNAMLARLEDARARQQRFVSDASHELRNPIAAIRQQAEVAASHPERTDVEALAAEVLAEDLRLQRLAEDLLLLARADEHTLELSARPLDLDDLVLDEAHRLRQLGGLTIDTSGVAAARMQGDRVQLQRVLQNLGENAARHAATVVRFELREADGHAVLDVDDDGPGVPPESRDAVFERFTRLDEARDRVHGGAGLGLAIVAEIVAAHGGTATVGDAPAGGARFEVTLPLAGS